MKSETTHEAICMLQQAVAEASSVLAETADVAPEAQTLKDLSQRVRKLARAWGRPQSLGFFGPSQSGKSFLVGALLSHELGSLKVLCGDRELDFLREINPAKGVESTGVVTRFSTRPAAKPLRRADFPCQLMSLEQVLESLATGFLVECTSPPVDVDAVERCLSEARLQAGPPASPVYREAWETVWHNLLRKYQDRHPYLNQLRRHGALQSGAWKRDLRTAAGWQMAYSLLMGGPGYAADLDHLLRLLVQGLEAVGYAEQVEVGLGDVRADSEGASLIDAACLNSLGAGRTVVRAYATEPGREVAVEPGVLSALIAEIRLCFHPAPGSLLDHCDILDFPGGRALKGINGFGQAELNTGKLENAIEVYKRGKLTFLFEQYSVDREITALVLCSPGPTKPEAIQLQTQVESWLAIRHGAPTPQSPQEIEAPSLFLALTKFDMSLGALRADNARERWESRVQEACIEFWARGQSSWINNWGARGKPFVNAFWIRNPYADQMQALKPGEDDYEAVRLGYQQARAVQRYIENAEDKWQAVDGVDANGLPKSGIPLLASRLRAKLVEDVKAKELTTEARAIQAELKSLFKALTPSKDEAEEQARRKEAAEALVDALNREMHRTYSGSVFGDLVRTLVAPEQDLQKEVRKAYETVVPMSIKTSDKVKKVLVHVLKWWAAYASERVGTSEFHLPSSPLETFIREVFTSRSLVALLGNAVFPYFSRSAMDVSLVASILQVKVCDAMLGLFVDKDRRTPQIPVHLSYAEDPGNTDEQAGSVDWSDVSFSDDGVDNAALKVEIVFAGSHYFRHWASQLPDFFLSNQAGPKKITDDQRTCRLIRLLGQVETIDVPAE